MLDIGCWMQVAGCRLHGVQSSKFKVQVASYNPLFGAFCGTLMTLGTNNPDVVLLLPFSF